MKRPTLDDVVCPACIKSMADKGGWHQCERCGYESDKPLPTVRQMLVGRGKRIGPTWSDVDLQRWTHWVVREIRREAVTEVNDGE